MNPSRRYIAYLVAPPLIVLLPVALAYLYRVATLGSNDFVVISVAATAAYIAGAIGFAMYLLPSIEEVETAVESKQNPSGPVSDCLQRTEIAAAGLWIAWGVLVAMTGAAYYTPTLFGVQVFGEAALIIAAPAMAWSYWGGKSFLIRRAGKSAELRYTGKTYSIGVKIAIVFIGFFVVSVGALIQLIAALIARRAAQPNFSAQAIGGEIALFGVFIALLTAALFAMATYVLARDITRPIRELTNFAGAMANGHLDVQPRIFSDDEIGDVAARFVTTRENLRALVRRIGSSGNAITSGVRLMSAGTDSLVLGSQDQSRIAESAQQALTTVRAEAQSVIGAVANVAEVTYDSATRASELRASSEEVARRMDDLLQSVEKTTSSTNQIEASTRETSRRTTSVSDASMEVLSFVSEMDATIEQIHRTSEATASLSNEVRQNAVSGREAVSETMQGIRTAQDSTRRTAGAFEALQKSLGQIDQILLLIEDLTNRTNLLSFNAAIIAAQAGTQDFGFSVIADEVRQLADKTRGATKEISTIIRGVQPIAREAVHAIEEGVLHVDKTVDLARRAEAALGTILSSADRSLETARSISKSLQDQTDATRHLHELMEQMSENVAQIHRATAGEAEATQLLAREAERVRDIASLVKRASDEQTLASGGIATAMEQIVSGIENVRTRVELQLQQAEDVEHASGVTLSIAKKNNTIAEEFSSALSSIVRNGQDFESEVARFRV